LHVRRFEGFDGQQSKVVDGYDKKLGDFVPNTKRMKDFFISYTKADKAWAEWIAWTLEEASRLVIIQAWDFRPGGNFVLDMQRAASGTEKTIVVLSPAYLEAEYTQPEWAAALAQDPDGKQRKLIPIRVAECRPTGILAPITYVDLLGLPQDDARAVLLGAFSERAKPSSMPAFPGAQPSDVSAARPVYPGTINATAASTAKILVTLVESADQSRRLSASQRLRFTRQLNSILPQQFNMLLFAANPEPGLVPPMPAAQGDRISALLTWAEGPGGCGFRCFRSCWKRSYNLQWPRRNQSRVNATSLQVSSSHLIAPSPSSMRQNSRSH
jgi:hypothetical protein